MTDGIYARIEYTDGTQGTYLVHDWSELWKKIGGRPVESIEAHRAGGRADAKKTGRQRAATEG